MYINSGMLAMMAFPSIVANYKVLSETLEKAESGETPMTDAAYENHKRWEEDMHAYFVRTAEQRGLTNVRNDSMSL